MSDPEICFLTAIELSRLMRSGELTATEIMEAHLSQIDRVNPIVNAIVTLVPEAAMEQARNADLALARGDHVGPLHGLPIAHKDLVPTKGIRTTFGSAVYRNYVPDEDGLIIERLKKAGAITIGKTNTPEFGAGSQTFNKIFGETLNPYDTKKTCGGSSGGAAVALACGMVPLADGSDMGGSLRNPASFCNVVGFRTSSGRVPIWPNPAGWFPFQVQGPMARTIQDVALMLSVIAGPDPRSPISIPEKGEIFRASLRHDFSGARIAWSPDLGGLPVDPRVTDVLEAQRPVFKKLGCLIDERSPDLRDVDEIFKIWRAWRFALAYSDLLKTHRDLLKDTVVWNIEEGLKLTGPQIAQAEIKRTQLYHRMRRFMDQYDFLVLPTTQVPPFNVDQQYIKEINNVIMDTYICWMKSCYFITVTGLPAISVPCGFTPEGLPVGIQIVGRYQSELPLLQIAFAFEQLTRVGEIRPPLLKNLMKKHAHPEQAIVEKREKEEK